MNNIAVVGILAWIVPGLGHLIQGRMFRGLILAGAIWLMFIIGVASGGAYYPGFDYKDGQLLYLLNMVANLGNGLGNLIVYLVSRDPAPDVAARATFEYGGRFLETAGLLNFLAIMDALDINIGRKR